MATSAKMMMETPKFDWELKKRVAMDIMEAGYGVANFDRHRIYRMEAIDKSTTMVILKDPDERSRRIAERGMPLFRLLRKSADVIGTFTNIRGNEWKLEIEGRENYPEMMRLAKTLTVLHALQIQVIELSPNVTEKERYF